MNKTELIAQVAEKTGLSKKDSELAVNASLETITETLIQGEKVRRPHGPQPQDQEGDRDPRFPRSPVQGRQGSQGSCR